MICKKVLFWVFTIMVIELFFACLAIILKTPIVPVLKTFTLGMGIVTSGAILAALLIKLYQKMFKK